MACLPSCVLLKNTKDSLWEHRFYGASLPFSENATADRWQSPDTEQALEDVVLFANPFAHPDTAPSATIPSDPLLAFPVHPSKTP
ncbi:hypothetical protein BYT27DRAFT_7264647 [Phlegmacium glaucopus]|nr:hypothetical protein BYT27DRAFT_7264647 [Phlegmacium glaucopus]